MNIVLNGTPVALDTAGKARVDSRLKFEAECEHAPSLYSVWMEFKAWITRKVIIRTYTISATLTTEIRTW